MAQRLNYQRPWLYPKQEAAIFCPERYAIIEATTKAGKTVGCIIWLTEQAIQGKPRQNFWWVAPVYPQAKIAFRRLKAALPRDLYTHNESELTITLGGRVIWFKTADNPDSLYGEDVYAAVIDEATRCKEEAWHAVRSTLTATQGPVRIIGNVKGKKNWAYQLARKAESGEPGMHYAKMTAPDAVDAGILPAAEVEDAKRMLPEAVFRELYMAESSDDEGNPFGIKAIQACVGALSQLPVSVWAWDLAKSNDWTVGVGLDEHGAVARLERWNAKALPAGMTGEYWAGTITKIREVTGETPALIDATGLGDPVFEAIAKDRAFIQAFKFTSQSKQQLMEGLAVAIQQRQVTYPDGWLVRELEVFEYEYTRTGVTYSAPAGMHDDGVCALAMAAKLLLAKPVAFAFHTFDETDDEQEERDAAEQAAMRAEAIRVVDDQIKAQGYYWPGEGA